eukprot:gene7600-9732_t
MDVPDPPLIAPRPNRKLTASENPRLQESVRDTGRCTSTPWYRLMVAQAQALSPPARPASFAHAPTKHLWEAPAPTHPPTRKR